VNTTSLTKMSFVERKNPAKMKAFYIIIQSRTISSPQIQEETLLFSSMWDGGRGRGIISITRHFRNRKKKNEKDSVSRGDASLTYPVRSSFS